MAALNECEARKEKWKMEKFRPKMDFMKAKRTLGINMSLQPAELSMQEVQRRFVAKNAAVGSRVSLSSSLFFLCKSTSQIVEQMSGIYLQHCTEIFDSSTKEKLVISLSSMCPGLLVCTRNEPIGLMIKRNKSIQNL